MRPWLLLAALVFAQPALAQPAQTMLRPLCPDRPSKGTSACTVDKGHVQLEADLFNGTYDRTGPLSTHIIVFADPTLKLGVTDNFDVEANLAPYIRITTHDASSGAETSQSGIGDLF